MTRLVERWESLLVPFLLVFSILVRIPVMVRHPLPAGDGVASNLEMAVNLSQGEGFSTMRKWTLYDDSMDGIRPEGNRQPAMAVMLLAVFEATGPGFLPAQLLALLIGTLCLVMCWMWARRLFGGTAALLTLAFLSVTPVFVWFSVQPDSLLLFTAAMFAVLILADREEIGFPLSALLGFLVGLSYLARTQGMVLVLSIGIWILYRGGSRRVIKALLFGSVFLATCAPWLARNISAFGSPTHTQGGQFLVNENHWAAWEVRETAPEPMDMLRFQGPAAVASYVARGVLRVLEPVTTGSLHRGEIFGQPSLVGFAILALLALRDRKTRERMLLPVIAAVPPLLLLVLHEHSGRYLAFFIVMVTALGSSGLPVLRRLAGKSAAYAALVLLLAPFAYPLGALLSDSSAERARDALEISEWIRSRTLEDEWVVTYPNVELLIWDYRRPTLTMPNDYEMLLWPCLQEHGVRYVVVDPSLPVMRPRLSHRWMRSADGAEWQLVDPPPFLEEVHRSSSGSTIVYEMTGVVPEGFMAVPSLPRDNMRALPPSGAAW
ncbi:MAG: hypothetical protein AVO35_09015 [Candidatus Aegiribacteria sp. MLS_C]|nr:MAG: hypothetical protein AVO35_09015 [Candidatus Aegiribacteria sp. MLS_C]